jgi:hypothetical protein
MPQTNDEWYQAGPQEFYRYFDPYPAQREAEGELTAAQANVIMRTPYLLNFYFRKVVLFRYLEAQIRWGE